MARWISAVATLAIGVAIVHTASCRPDGTREPRPVPHGGVRAERRGVRPGEESAMDTAVLRQAVEHELRGNLLPFWRERSLDRERGGFIGEMDHDGAVRTGAAKGLVLNARLLWTFAALGRRLAGTKDLDLARRAYAYLEKNFRDRVHGGYVWLVDADGRPLPGDKKVYGQAFAIYALAEYHLATGDASGLAAARRVFELLERHAHDDANGGYLEACAADWSPTQELRLSDGDMLAAKSMNTHLHVLEAYTTLYRAWPDSGVKARLRELIALFGERIVDRAAGHLRPFFDERWTPLAEGYTYGHDIEASWLLAEAAAALGDEQLEAEVSGWAMALARAVLAEGVDRDGALVYEGRDGIVVDGRRDWWCQAEAAVGFQNAYQASGEPAFAAAAAGVWRFVESALVDRVNGEWFWRVRADGSVDTAMPKVSAWKCPYHTVRACLELMERLERPAPVPVTP